MMMRWIRLCAPRVVGLRGASRGVMAGAGLLLAIAPSFTASLVAQSPRPPQDTGTLRHVADSLRATGRDSVAAGAAFVRLGERYESMLDTERAAAAFQQASELATASRDTSTLAESLQKLGLLYWRVNQYERSLAFLDRAKSLREATKDRAGLARVLNNIGASYYQLGVYEPALDAFLQSLRLRREVGDTAGVARTLTNVGKTYHDWRQFARAREVLEEAVATAQQSRSAAALGYALNSLALLEIDTRQFDRARELIGQSVAAYNANEALVSRADTVDAWSLNASARGLLLVREGRAREALPILDSVLLVGLDRGSVRGQSRAYLYLAEAHQAVGDIALARSEFQRALALARSVTQRVLALDALQHLAAIEESTGNSAAALGHLRAHQMLRDTIFDQATAQRLASLKAREETERAQLANAALRDEQQVQASIIARQRLIGALGALILLLTAALMGALISFNRRERTRLAALSRTNAELEKANRELGVALSEVRTLSGLIPICASCKSIRDDQGYWESVESYLANHSDVTFSHSICQSCGPKLYGDLWPERVPLDASTPRTDTTVAEAPGHATADATRTSP